MNRGFGYLSAGLAGKLILSNTKDLSRGDRLSRETADKDKFIKFGKHILSKGYSIKKSDDTLGSIYPTQKTILMRDANPYILAHEYGHGLTQNNPLVKYPKYIRPADRSLSHQIAPTISGYALLGAIDGALERNLDKKSKNRALMSNIGAGITGALILSNILNERLANRVGKKALAEVVPDYDKDASRKVIRHNNRSYNRSSAAKLSDYMVGRGLSYQLH